MRICCISDLHGQLPSIDPCDLLLIAGNHDFVFERQLASIPSLRWHYLLRTTIDIDGIRIWGTPDQLPFFDWAFNVPEEDLHREFANIPQNTDIIISHGPPHGYGDLVPAARASPGLSADSFRKRTSLIEFDQPALDQLAQPIIDFANTEGFDAHAKSASTRASINCDHEPESV